jgi:hypothetical protein
MLLLTAMLSREWDLKSINLNLVRKSRSWWLNILSMEGKWQGEGGCKVCAKGVPVDLTQRLSCLCAEHQYTLASRHTAVLTSDFGLRKGEEPLDIRNNLIRLVNGNGRQNPPVCSDIEVTVADDPHGNLLQLKSPPLLISTVVFLERCKTGNDRCPRFSRKCDGCNQRLAWRTPGQVRPRETGVACLLDKEWVSDETLNTAMHLIAKHLGWGLGSCPPTEERSVWMAPLTTLAYWKTTWPDPKDTDLQIRLDGGVTGAWSTTSRSEVRRNHFKALDPQQLSQWTGRAQAVKLALIPLHNRNGGHWIYGSVQFPEIKEEDTLPVIVVTLTDPYGVPLQVLVRRAAARRRHRSRR